MQRDSLSLQEASNENPWTSLGIRENHRSYRGNQFQLTSGACGHAVVAGIMKACQEAKVDEVSCSASGCPSPAWESAPPLVVTLPDFSIQTSGFANFLDVHSTGCPAGT